ncbi:sugar transferase [Spongorhabdus nitratireducens]
MYKLTKRSFDIIVSAITILLLSPLFILIAIFIKINSPGPVFFRQERVTQGERRFYIHKFRTMKHSSKKGKLITTSNDSRITSLGNHLRKYKIDELPQLIDVFLGDMSLVGPRPEVPSYVNYYSKPAKKKIFSVRAGITDPASILLVDESLILSKSKDPEKTYVEELLPKKIDHYISYVDHSGFFYDIRIILQTIYRIFFRRSHSTIPD